MAMQVGLRKATVLSILLIKAKEAYKDGINFYIGNELVWLADFVPSKYIFLSGGINYLK